MINKKALTHSVLLDLILVLITAILIFVFIQSMYGNIEYENSVVDCKQFVTSVNGDEIYFDKLNIPTTKFENGFKNFCPSLTVEVEDDSVKSAVDLADDCWRKFGKGDKFLGEYMVDTKLCFYCGNVLVKEEVTNFAEDFARFSQEEEYAFDSNSKIVNLNSVNLGKAALPTSLNKGDELFVVYTIFKDPNFKVNSYSKAKMWFEGYISNSGGYSGLLTQFLADSSNIETMGGVIVSKKNITYLDKLGCKTYIPLKNYEK